MSRQRLRPSLVETSTQPCPHCGGTGFIRSTESTALYVLRSIEEEGMRRRSAEICVHVPTTVALYILNQKRDSLVQLEARYAIRVLVAQDDALIPPAFRLERLRAYAAAEPAALPAAPLTQAVMSDEEEEEIDETAEASEAEQESGEAHGRSRRRRRRRRRHDEEPAASQSAALTIPTGDELADDEGDLAGENGGSESEETDGDEESDAERRRRRRGRRGGRRRVRREGGVEPGFEEPRPAVDTVEILPTPEAQESDQTLAEARASWSDEIGAVAIETASLPALAGDGQASSGDISAAVEGEPDAARPAERTGYEANDQLSRDASDTEREDRQRLLPTAEAEQGVPYPGEMERELEPASAEPEQQQKPEPTHPVETVTEKPANPRRGWWQRLIQS
jgi:ribonuclease E